MSLDSPVAICNYALSLIKSTVVISSLDDITNEYAVFCNLIYVNARDTVLSRNAWSFAKRRANIPKVAGTEDAYEIPVDCITVLSFGERVNADWDIEGDRIIAKTALDKPVLLYVQRVENPLLMSEIFKNALAHEIAIRLGTTYNPNVLSFLRPQYEEILQNASQFDARQVKHKIQVTSWQWQRRHQTGAVQQF